MTDSNTSRPYGIISLELNEASAYGTSGNEFRLWVDYIFDIFGATLQRRLRRYFVAALFATAVWIICLLIVAPFGLLQTYLTTPGIYFFWIGITWCMNSLRWLSQVYHVRTNWVRPCFPVPDDEYKILVTPFARTATNNKEIFVRTAIYILPIWTYFVAIVYGPKVTSNSQVTSWLIYAFPSAFPSVWRDGSNLLPKLVVLDILFAVALLCVYTGFQITFATTPLYAKLGTIKIVSMPSLISERFHGILSLYLSGAAMWSFGVVLVELLYGTRLDILGGGFAATVVVFGMLAYLLPRRSVRKIWHESKDQAVSLVLHEYYAAYPETPTSQKIKELEEFLQSLDSTRPGDLNLAMAIDLVSGQLLPLIPLLLNSYLSKMLGLL